MARVARRETANGWTTYGPPEEDIATDRIKGALDAAVHDCRLFARLAREARLQDLPTRLHLSWGDFCAQRLHHPSDVVEAMIAGIEVLGEEIPIPAAVAERVGRALGKHGGDRKSQAAKNQGSDTTSIGRGAMYLLARLERDYPKLAVKVHSGELTANGAGRIAGIVKAKTPLEQLHHWWRKASTLERKLFLKEHE